MIDAPTVVLLGQRQTVRVACSGGLFQHNKSIPDGAEHLRLRFILIATSKSDLDRSVTDLIIVKRYCMVRSTVSL
jgi:hypothetical protein